MTDRAEDASDTVPPAAPTVADVHALLMGIRRELRDIRRVLVAVANEQMRQAKLQIGTADRNGMRFLAIEHRVHRLEQGAAPPDPNGAGYGR